MHPIIYDVAASIDGYISGPQEDISKFTHQGPVVDDYRERLLGYSCAIMGRKTYEFAYKYGLAPGANPYPHMNVFVFSSTIELPSDSDVTIVGDASISTIENIRNKQNGSIYLCGGGVFAGTLLSQKQVDIIRLKRAPILLGEGVQLFNGASSQRELRCIDCKNYADGNILQEFELAKLK